MRIDPEFASVGKFFEESPVYKVHIYQRGYAWEKDEINDFLKDLELVYNARKEGNPKNHFLGSIVTVQEKLSGVVGKHSYELVDGQQRMTTFVLLAAAIYEITKDIETTCQQNSDNENERIAHRRAEKIYYRFIEFEQEINRVVNIQPVLTLSKTDNPFFSSLIRGNILDANRDSHIRLKNAIVEIKKRVKTLTFDTNINTFLDNLEILIHNIDGDFSLLRIITYDRKEAYTLFQVLNDRGRSLTEGDLLRAKTLEMLEGFPLQQQQVEGFWDNILKDKTTLTENYLHWIYASFQGKRAGKSTLFDDLLKDFYPENTNTSISSTDADNIFLTTQNIKTEIENTRKLATGEWLFPVNQPITAWDRNRLALLMKELNNTNSIPLLLAAAKLEHRKFAEIVTLVERMMFRYTIICGQHHSSITDIYEFEAMQIRRNPSGYTLDNLKNKLQNLLNTKADDRLFKASLDSLVYSSNGKSNKPLKYFLLTIENYWRWYNEDSANGTLICKDKSMIYQFEDTTLEHIYPRNASGTIFDVTMDELKNTIGNLTILSSAENQLNDDDEFAIRKPTFQSSSSKMNNEIGKETSWDRIRIVKRTDKLKEMAVKVFSII
jgi:uncharacterized protein with ParB-like and HNH nuclease domain